MTYAIQAVVPETMTGRVGAVLLVTALLFGAIYLAHRLYSASFVNGFLVATGLFLTLDLVLVHWVFELHRITSGSEAIWLEVVFVLAGFVFITIGLRREIRRRI